MMKKISKSSMCFLLAITMIISFSISVSASIPKGDSSDEKPLTQQEILTEINNNLNDPSISQEIKNNLILKKNVMTSRSAITPRATGSTALAMTYCKQETSYWCGPATAKQTLLFFGLYYPQSSLAERFKTSSSGTDGVIMRTQLNAILKQYNKNQYVPYKPASPSSLLGIVDVAVRNVKAPPIMRMKAAAADWRYPTDGHYLNISGYWNGSTTNMNNAELFLVDPYIQYKYSSITDGTYLESVQKCYDVIKKHWSQEIWY